jgi:DNA-directed RNA polymerase sigma subunit (sigma70/sigma32)
MALVLKWRHEGRTLEWIGRKLTVTKERVRQIQKLAEYRRK